MSYLFVKSFIFMGSIYYLRLDPNEDTVEVCPVVEPAKPILVFDSNLNVRDSHGKPMGTLCSNDDVHHGFIDGVKVADAFNIYDAEVQFSCAYLRREAES